MPDITLKAKLPLGGYDREFTGISLTELGGRALVSVATPLDGRDALAKAVSDAYGAELPEAGSSTVSSDGQVRLLGLQRDQMFLMYVSDGDLADKDVAENLGDAGYYTDQSDSWVVMRVAGPDCRNALERICMLDIHPDRFAVGAVARTTMEHLGVIILRDEEDAFVLLSPRSSAKSFLHALVTSVDNVT